MKKYPTLYARSNTDAILEWYMEQNEDKYRSVSGTQDGLKVTSDWTMAEPKNEGKTNATSGERQASLEIKSKYEKRLKSGGYFTDIKDVDQERFFQVMLAKSYGDYKGDIDWSKGVGVQIKYNGGRIVARKEGLFTRKGEKYISIPHIEEALKPLFDKFPDAILDGEGFNYPLREKLNEIMKLLRKTVHVTQKDLERSKELIRFYVYDGFGFPAGRGQPNVAQTANYLLRKEAIDNAFFADCFIDRYQNIIEKVPTWIIHSEKELEKLYEQFLADNHEGAIIRILGQGYENKRSKYLLKYKPVDDGEYKVIDIQQGQGNWAGIAKIVSCQRVDNKKFSDGTDTFNATFVGNMQEADECLKNKDKIIGKVCTIYYNGTTGYGKPNYARFDWNNYDKGH